MKFGLISPPVRTHLKPLLFVARELVRQGHEVVVFNYPDARQLTDLFKLPLVEYGARDFPAGTMAAAAKEFGERRGARAMIGTLRHGHQDIHRQFAELPPLLRAEGVEALLVDRTSLAGGTLADLCGVPFVTLYTGLFVDLADDRPPPYFNWIHRSSKAAMMRNRIGNQAVRTSLRPFLRTVNRFRRQHKLPLYTNTREMASSWCQVVQAPLGFDLPGAGSYESNLVCTGGWGLVNDPEPAPAMPERRHARDRMIYASLGTITNRHPRLFKMISDATAGLGVEVVCGLGDPHADAMTGLGDHMTLVPFAPQRDCIEAADLVITHGGLNSTVETLAAGKPLVVLPQAHEQPGIGTRVNFHGLGMALAGRKLHPVHLQGAVKKLLDDPAYAKRAQAFLGRGEGAPAAATAICQALGLTNSPTESPQNSPGSHRSA